MFANPIMLAGIGGAMIPVVIHLLSRARYQSVEWGAMMFLDSPGQNRERAGRLRDFSLLGLRMATIALLAMALARPVAGGLTEFANEPGRVTAAIIVDCSASMAHEDGGMSRIAAARTAVLRILSGLRRGERVCLIPAGGPAPANLLFTGDLQSVANRVSELKPAAGSADFQDAIDSAIDALSREEGGEKRLYLVCDHQAASWANVDDDAAADCKRRLAQMAATFSVIAVGSDSSENVSIDSVAAVNPPIVAANVAQLEVRLHNYAHLPRLGVPVTVRLDERDEQSTTVNLPPQQSASVILPVKFTAAGSHVVDVEMRGDGGDVDDHREVLIDVAEPIRTLIVRDQDVSGADYLRTALAPYAASGREGTDVANIEIVSADEWDETLLGQYQVLILDDVATLSSPQARAVEQFVYGGRGLVIAPGPAARVGDYNRLLYHEESSALPALLRPAESSPKPLHIDPASIDAAHPLTRFLADHPIASSASIERYFPIAARSAAARVLVASTNGEPLLIESPYGSGHVALWTCGLGARWTSLPLTNLYLPLMQSMLRFVSSGNSPPPHNVVAGQEIVATFPVTSARVARAVIVRPDGSRDQADVVEFEDHVEVRYGRTQLAGIYSITLGARGQEQVRRFAITPSTSESDLTPLSSAQWNDLGAKLGFSRVNEARKIRSTIAEVTSGEYWLALLVGVIGLLVVEMGVTGAWWRSSRRTLHTIGGMR